MRAVVPNEKVPFSVPWVAYRPVEYEREDLKTGGVLSQGNKKKWADPPASDSAAWKSFGQELRARPTLYDTPLVGQPIKKVQKSLEQLLVRLPRQDRPLLAERVPHLNQGEIMRALARCVLCRNRLCTRWIPNHLCIR